MSIVFSAIALFGLVFFGSIRMYNCAVAASGVSKIGERGSWIDLALAVCATILFVSEKLG